MPVFVPCVASWTVSCRPFLWRRNTSYVRLASTEDWNRIFTINGLGTFLCYKYAAKQMIKQGHGGRIVGASSIAGKQGQHIHQSLIQRLMYMYQVIAI